MPIRPVPMQLLVSSDQFSADLHIMGDIRRGSIWDSFDETGASAERKTESLDVAKALADMPKSVQHINVHINSYGGEVAEGLAIYNALKSHPAQVTTYCEGFACSIASVVFMAGDERIMRDSSMLMIHNPSNYARGTSDELRKAADDLDVIRETSIAAYMSHATCSREELIALMDAETWLTPERSVELGLATATESDEDESEPTQSARRHVMHALMGARPAVVQTVTPDVDEIVRRVVDQLLLAGVAQVAQQVADEQPEQDPDESDEAEQDEAEQDEPEPQETAAQRFARIFQQLSE